MSDDNAEKVWEKHVADIAPYPVGHHPDRGADERGRMYKRGFMAGRASRDAEVLDDGLRESRIAELRKQLATERTRADKAEAQLASARETGDAYSESLARHVEQSILNETRLREVIERVREASEKVFYLKTVHRGFTEEDYSRPLVEATPIKEALAAVPVEPQAEVDTTRERIARNGDMVLRGQGVISDRNGPFRLSLKVDGIWQPVVLNTYDWNVEWADQQTPDHENGGA